MTPRPTFRVERLGRIAYAPMLELQQRRHAEVADGADLETLFLLEHEPVVTTGKNASLAHVLYSEHELGARGVSLHLASRGGDATYHGPGQIVGYPIFKLGPREQDVKGYVYKLEEVLLSTCEDFGVMAERREGLRGIFVGEDKIAAIGVRIARWTTMHGFALNVGRDLTGFSLIVPCGLRDHGVTSIGRLCDTTPTLREVEDRLIAHTARVFAREPSA